MAQIIGGIAKWISNLAVRKGGPGSRFTGIGPRLVVRVLMFSSVVTLVLTLLQLYLDYSRDVGDINDRLDEIRHSSLDSIAQALWSLDENQLTLQLQGILRLPHIRAAEVRETSRLNQPIAIALGERGTSAVLAREFPLLHTIRGNAQPIGILYVEASLSEVYRSLLDRALFILVSQGAKTFLVTLFIVYIFHRLVTRHLADIAAYVAGYRVGQPNGLLNLERAPPPEADELDQVVEAFNKMVDNLQNSYQRLHHANVQLEIDNDALVHAEAALRDSERLFRDYAETASDWFWETDPDHRFTFISEVAEAFSIDRSKRIGLRRWDFAADVESEPEKWRQHQMALDRHEPFRGLVYTTHGKDGKLHYVSISGKPIFGEAGDFLGYRGTTTDVTARSTAEARVRELSIAVEQSPAGIAIVDPTGSLLYSNRVFLQITGLPETDHGTPMTAILSPEVWQRLSAAAQSGEVAHEEISAHRQSQESYWALVSVSGIRSPDGSIKRLVVALQDISGAKAEQQEREALQQRLQQAGKMEAIGRLAGGIAHDFNNLLGAMMGFSQFLVEDLPEGTDSHNHAERLVNICERGKDLIEQLLAFAQARDIERRVIDLTAVLQRCEGLLATSLPSSSHLLIEAGDEPLPVLGNEGQFHQILLNLCLNAKDALGKTPGTITVSLSRLSAQQLARSTQEHLAAGHLGNSGDYAVLSVSDTGPGMDTATRARIFEPFYTTKGLGRGTGLGLAVVHGIVTACNGAITIETAPGAGTTFRIYLPLAKAAPADEVVSLPQHEDIHGSERILVVDDDADLAQTLRIGLHRYGYEVVSLSDPMKALDAFMASPDHWDLVVSDQVMPGMTGLALVARLKELRPTLRAILYTGFEAGITERVARRQGVDALLYKPIAPQALAACIRRVMAAGRPTA